MFSSGSEVEEGRRLEGQVLKLQLVSMKYGIVECLLELEGSNMVAVPE